MNQASGFVGRFMAPDIETTRTLLNSTLVAYRSKAPKVMDTLEHGFAMQ